MSTRRIPVSGPWITDKEIAYVADATANAWYEGANRFQARFEAAFAAHLGRRYVMSLPSCTSALHLSLMALGVGPGDEVIVPEATWIASMAPITYVGATPVFADIDRATWCLSAASFEAHVTPRTKAVIPVDLYGSVPDWDALLAVARRHGVAVIEDAAEAIGAEHRGRRAGSFGDVSVFSFHGSKTLTTGEGGLLATDREDLFARAQVLRDHGRKPGDRFFFNQEIAHKYKMSALQAALGLAQLERVEELVARKREIFGWYREALAGVDGVALNAEPEGTRNGYWMPTVILDAKIGLGKEQLMEGFDRRGIDTRPFFYPLSTIPACASLPSARGARDRNSVAHAITPYGVNLPSPMNLTGEEASRVAAALGEMIAEAGTRGQAAPSPRPA